MRRNSGREAGAEGRQSGTRPGDRWVTRDTDGREAIAQPAQCPLCIKVDVAGPRGRRQTLQRADEGRQKRRSSRGEPHASRRAAREGPLVTEVNEEGLVHNDDGCGTTTVHVNPVCTPVHC